MQPEQIKKYIQENKRGWGKFLVELIEPKISQGYNAQQISDWLAQMHQINYSARNIRAIINRQQAKKLPASTTPTPPQKHQPPSNNEEKKINKTQNKTQSKRIYSELSLDEKLEVNKKLAAQQAEFSTALIKKSTLKSVENHLKSTQDWPTDYGGQENKLDTFNPKLNMLKKVNFIVQSKGGVGKSLFAWFAAQVKKEQPVMFVDLDKSTRTSTRLTQLLGQQKVAQADILDVEKKLDRVKFMNMFEDFAQLDYHEFFVDLGAPESDEFKSMLEFDFPADLVAAELKSLNIVLKIYVVIAGTDAYGACMDFHTKLFQLTDGAIETTMLLNEGTFGGFEKLQHIHTSLQKLGIDYVAFGNIGQADSGKEIIQVITDSADVTTLRLASRMLYRRELEKVNAILN